MKIAVSVSVGSKPLEPQVRAIQNVLATMKCEYVVILCSHTRLDPDGSKMVLETAAKIPGVSTALADSGTFSRAYLAGWEKGLELDCDYVISMDADGSHDPQDLVRFIKALNQKRDVVCSSRFMDGAENKYPFQRVLLSKSVTFLANIFLVSKDNRLTDFASGYEALSNKAVKDMLSLCPADEWVSVKIGPYHLQNTILRWLLIEAGHSIYEIPIKYGVHRKGKVLGIDYVLRALWGFIVLLIQRGKMRTKKRILKKEI
jgi:glycosyltransferase involved in cell wall biosynthesis